MSSDSAAALKGKKHRSPNYPYISLEKAVDLVSKLHGEYKAYGVPINLVHKNWEYKELSGAGNQAVAAAKAYGLIEVTGEGDSRKITVSKDGIRIVGHAPDRAELLKKAALAPKIHREILDHYGSHGLPATDLLRTYLLWDRAEGQRFNPDVVDEFIERFRDTLAFAGIAESDTIEDYDTENCAQIDDPPQKGNQGAASVSALAPSQSESIVVRDFPIPLISGGLAVIKIPIPMLELDFQQLIGTLTAWKAAIVRTPPTDQRQRVSARHRVEQRALQEDAEGDEEFNEEHEE